MNQPSLYGFIQIIREYMRYPSFLPTYFTYEHGWTPLSEANGSELQRAEELMLVFNKRRAEAWEKKSNIPVAIMGAPFVHYRKIHKIEKCEEARGTVAFPSHSTEHMDAVFDIDKYCQMLFDLPPEYHPITICLHGDDLTRNKDKFYRKYNFDVVSAGPKWVTDFSFVDNFYNILKKHKYATSNQVGSYSFYAVEMGIPFFVYGNPAIMENNESTDFMPRKYSICDYEMGGLTTKIFSWNNGEISKQQIDFVITELGLNDCLSRRQLRNLILKVFFKKTGQRIYHSTIELIRSMIELLRKIYLKLPFIPLIWRFFKKTVRSYFCLGR